MKPALYYAIRRGMHDHHIVAVTSVKQRHWYGRDTRDNAIKEAIENAVD